MAKVDPAELLDIQGMMRAYGISRTRVYQMIRHPQFPAPLEAPYLKDRIWIRGAVDAWRTRTPDPGGRKDRLT